MQQTLTVSAMLVHLLLDHYWRDKPIVLDDTDAI